MRLLCLVNQRIGYYISSYTHSKDLWKWCYHQTFRIFINIVKYEASCHICNIFHWRRPYSAIDRKWAQVSYEDSRRQASFIHGTEYFTVIGCCPRGACFSTPLKWTEGDYDLRHGLPEAMYLVSSPQVGITVFNKWAMWIQIHLQRYLAEYFSNKGTRSDRPGRFVMVAILTYLVADVRRWKTVVIPVVTYKTLQP